MDLKEWARIFLKQRDLIKREILDLTEVADGFLIRTKDGEKRAVVQEKLCTQDAAIIVCANTKENVQQLVKGWGAYAKQENLLLVFANPRTNEKWLLKPHHHDKIADKGSLMQGLLAMHDAIAEV